MPNLLAIISKAQFEASHRSAKEGDALGFDRYVSTHASLTPLNAGGSLFLVTVRPPDERLWLLGELVDPTHDGKQWKSAPSSLAVRDITALIPSLRFANGKGLAPKKGALGMSLQTPRQLTDEDAALLRGKAGAPKASKPVTTPATAKESKPEKAAKKTVEVPPVPEAPAPVVAAGDGLALADVLAEWRQTRAPELEALIETLSKHHARAWPALDPSADDYDAQWNARAAELSIENLPTLLPGLWSEPLGAIPMRLRTLLDKAPDPRLGEALLTMIDEPPFTASSNFSAWTLLFKALPSMVDTRATKRLEARKRTKGGASQFWPKFAGWIEKALDELPEPAALSKEQAAGVAKRQKLAEKLLAGPPPAKSSAAPVKTKVQPVAASVLGALELALKSAEASRYSDALEPLRQAWELTRQEPFAKLLTTFAKVSAPSLPRFDEGKPAEVHAAWMKAGKTFDAKLVTPLLTAILKGPLSDTEERLKVMASWPADPRVAECVVERLIFGRDPYIGARPVLWKHAYELLAANADPRFVARLRKNAERLANAAAFDRNRAERPHATRTIEAYVERAAKVTPLQNDEARVLAALEAAASKAVAASKASQAGDRALELLQAINAAPDDPTPRLVYADFLAERGDPRAEFINLSVRLAQGEKVKSAHEACAKKLGIHPREFPKYHLGLLVKASVGFSTRVAESELDAFAEDPSWATVRDLSLERAGKADHPGAVRLLEKGPLYAVTRLKTPGALVAVASRRDFPWAIEHLELFDYELPADVRVGAFPRLRSMELPMWTPATDAFFANPLLAQIERFEMGGENTYGQAPIDLLIVHGVKLPRLEHVEIITSAFDFDVRVSNGQADVVFSVKSLPRARDDYFAATLARLKLVPRSAVRSFEVKGVKQPMPPHADALEAANAATVHLRG
ncbi:MAG: TIGR02996 domain-containing protein [Myxococcaceae bacterium]|nr:TIGR02996 domain-containing protein [Myxococcaceae bacterium]